jgi:hypothetical protein
MSNNMQATATRWTPETTVERDLVIGELNAILSSHHFRGSKRYPALLKYVVSKTLEGHSDELKERTLGVEVFERRPDYDTNADPVVRFSASEIRKRIAQYYHETGENSPLQIDLPLGSYVPEFKPRVERVEAKPSVDAGGPQEEVEAIAPAQQRRRVEWWTGGVLVLAAAAFGGYVLHKPAAPAIKDKLWSSLLRSSGPVLIVVGTSHPDRIEPEPVETTLMDHMTGPYHRVSISSAIALSRLAGVLQVDGKAYQIKEDAEASLADIRTRPVILVGALNNLWTIRLTGPLRFHFVGGAIRHILDVQRPEITEWTTDTTIPYASISSDYAVVARYHDPTTNGMVMVIGGLGPYGTETASEFVASPQYLDQLLGKLPAGWENKNLEMVIKTDVINGEAGPPHLLSSTTW